MKKSYLNNPIFWITICLPLVMWATIILLPTEDDWGAAPPEPNPEDFSLSILLPRYTSWRPFEHLYGWLVGHYRFLFPGLAHVIVVIGHYIGTIMVYKLCESLNLSKLSRNIATIFMFISVGCLTALTGCDGMSQTWVQTIGLISLYTYIKNKGKGLSWLLLVALATLIKENGMMWAIAVPIVGGFVTGKRILEVIRNLVYGCLFIVFYMILHFSLPTATNYELNTDYFQFSPTRLLRNLGLYILYTWIPADYASLFHPEHRNIIVFCITAIISLPFLIYVFIINRKALRNSLTLVLFIGMLIVSAPHTLTIFSLMHSYAGLGMAALLLGSILTNIRKNKTIISLFILYSVSCLYTAAHHYQAAYESGLMGKRLSLEAVKKTGKPAEKVFMVYVDDGYHRYSSYYTLPCGAMGWCIGPMWENKFEWPKEWNCKTILKAEETKEIPHLTDSIKREGYDCIWVLRNNHIDVIR